MTGSSEVLFDQVMTQPWGPACFSVAMINATTQRNLGQERVGFSSHLRSHNPSLMEVRTETQEGAETGTVSHCHPLAHSLTSFLMQLSQGVLPIGGRISYIS